MLETIKQYHQEIKDIHLQNIDELEHYRVKYLSKKGVITGLFEKFRAASVEEKRSIGKPLNELKKEAEEIHLHFKEIFDAQKNIDFKTFNDLSLPGEGFETGARHPISLVRKQIIDIFHGLGFVIAEGPEIEDDWHNFSALNFPEEHPARDMQDTFFIEKKNGKDDIALRTHTSSVQVRLMQNSKPPFRVIMPGRVYRNETISARAHCFFHQVEGMYVDKQVSFADLKQTLYFFVQEMFGADTKVRFRASYFPFTEPSAEMDISCTICKGKGCNLCKNSGWVEILGCGMIDPNVLNNCGIDSETYTGFAFGMGIERITNLKYQIKDLRLFSENDIRFLKQFNHEIV